MTQTVPNTEKLRTRRELAAELSICLRSVDNLIAARAIEHIRVGGAVRFSPEAIAQYKQARTVAAAVTEAD